MRNTLTLRLVLCLLLGALATPTAFADTTTLSYDPAGNISTRSTSFGTTTYTYDALNRLIAESGPAGNASYSYDANSNRLGDSRGNYTYSPSSNRIATRRGLPVSVDAAGNITSDGQGHTYIYNEEGNLSEARLNTVLLASYTYDYRGLRTRKVTTAAAPQGAQVVRYTYDEANHLIAENSATGAALRTYIWRDDTPVAQIDHIPTRHIRYFASDHLNTPRAAMDETGKVIWRWESDAFGNTPANEDPDGDGIKTTVNLRFPGQYYDRETGLHYNTHRYYDPSMGQYTQSDPIGLRGGSFSTYEYVNSNPLRYVDPEGLQSKIIVCVNGVCPPILPPGGSDDNLGQQPPSSGLILPTFPFPKVFPNWMKSAQQCEGEKQECIQGCEDTLNRDEAECFVAKAAYGKAAQAICLGKAKEFYAQCLRTCDGK